MIFKNLDCLEIGDRLRPESRHAFLPGTRCYITSSLGDSQTTETAINQQTTVEAGTSATVTGANNSGIANVSGVAINGSKNNVSITTADPAIVQSALDSNSLVATEALATYSNLVTGQTDGLLQAQQESQANDDALVGAVANGVTAPGGGVVSGNSNISNPVGSTDSGDDSAGVTPTVNSVSIYLGIAVALVGLIYYFESAKKK
jgi:hypothetical protein